MTPTLAPAYTSYGANFAEIYDSIFPSGSIGPADLDWLAERIGAGRRVLELGIGTGRIAIPLTARLAQLGRDVEYRGIDISPEMLARLAAADPDGHITSTLGDIVSDPYGPGYDTILCLCATISMITSPAHQSRVFVNAAIALAPGGTLIVETHNAEFVRALHGKHTKITYVVPYPGHQRALVSFSTLNDAGWTIDHCWIDDGTTTFAREESRVTTLRELDTYAVHAGLEPLAHSAGLNGSSIEITSGTVTAMYRKPS